MTEPRIALSLRGLTVGLNTGETVVQDIDLELASGQILGIVGESGSGKTTTALAILGYCREGAEIQQGTITVGDGQIPHDDERRARAVRGREVAYVPQDPANSLNPGLRIARAMEYALGVRGRPAPTSRTVFETLEAVGLPSAADFGRRYPHQLSGGQQQRVLLGMALGREPALVVLDEPTTGLDVVTQAHILDVIERLRREHAVAMVYVSHDLAVVGQIADQIAVMYAGRVVESGPARAILTDPRHPYTRGLVSCIPDHRRPRRLEPMPGVAIGIGERPPGCAFAPRCPHQTAECLTALPPLESVDGAAAVRCLHWRELAPLSLSAIGLSPPPRAASPPILRLENLCADYRTGGRAVRVVSNVSLDVAAGECLALVGESGSGKTTIGRCIAGLHEPADGRILFEATEIAGAARHRSRELRRKLQIIFQNPHESLNPRHTVAQSIARPMRFLRGQSVKDARRQVDEYLARVRLPARTAARFPDELSGGERQRVAIARALAAEPELVVCDEITSALDVSVQAAILEILHELRKDLGLALLFVTHDLGVVTNIADRVVVLRDGIVLEQGSVDRIIHDPQNDYTRTLVDAAPRLPERAKSDGLLS